MNILGITRLQLNAFFINIEVSGSGASRVITVTSTDRTTTDIPFPENGTVTGISFGSDGSVTLNKSAGNPIVGSLLVAVQTIVSQMQFHDDQIPASIARDAEVAQLYAALAGATFRGAVRGIAPVANSDLTTKLYVDQQIAAISGTPEHHQSDHLDHQRID